MDCIATGIPIARYALVLHPVATKMHRFKTTKE